MWEIVIPDEHPMEWVLKSQWAKEWLIHQEKIAMLRVFVKGCSFPILDISIYSCSVYLFNPIRTTYLSLSLQIHVRAIWKSVTFPNCKFGKGQYTFYPTKLSRFAEKKWSSSEISEFHKGGPLQTGSEACLTNEKL